MNLQQSTAFCKPISASINEILSNSNFVPHIWYHKVLRGGNKPDDVGITILSEVLQLHLTSEVGEREFQLGYRYFKIKFNYTCDQIYEALLRLEKSYLITRKEKSGKNINDLFVTLNVENLLALHDEDNNKPNSDNLDLSSLEEISSNIDLYIDNTRDIEDKREENYISGTQFDENATEDKPTQGKILDSKPEGIIKTAKSWAKSLIRQPIAKFHPLTEEDAEHLSLSSGREFNLHFINQLVLHLGAKYPDHGFYTKKIFLKYMVSILANEMRQAVNVNNEGFRFKHTNEAGVAEEYLAKVEDSYGNKASDQVRRKVVASFEPIVAYKILTSCYFPEEAVEGHYEIKQRLAFELSEFQRDRLYCQILAVFGDRVRNIEITKNFKPVVKPQHISTIGGLQAPSIEHHVSENHASDTTALWGRIRSSLIDLYGEAIDKSWFSRLETAEDASSRSLILKGASFLTDYIQTNYSHVIERLCREENYTFKFC